MSLDKDFILNTIKNLGQKYGTNNVFNDIVICCAYSFANCIDFKEKRENEYIRIINKYSEEERKLFPKVVAALINEYEKTEEPIDILGDIYEKLNLIKKGQAQFFTPLNISKMMADIIINGDSNIKDNKDKNYISISDPTCGSGRNIYTAYSKLLHDGIKNNDIYLEGADIDLVCCCMTYIQLSLMGANAVVYHQNSLTMDVYDTFYTISYYLNKDLQSKLFKDKENKMKESENNKEEELQND